MSDYGRFKMPTNPDALRISHQSEASFKERVYSEDNLADARIALAASTSQVTQQPMPDNQAGTWLNDEQVITIDRAASVVAKACDSGLAERLHDIIRDRNFTKATKFPSAVAVQPQDQAHVMPQATGNPDGWMIDGSLLYRLNDDETMNVDEINITMANGSRKKDAREAAAAGLLNLICSSVALPAADKTAEREAFEQGEQSSNLTRAWGFGLNPDDYADPYVQHRWNGFQAGRASLATHGAAPELTDEQIDALAKEHGRTMVSAFTHPKGPTTAYQFKLDDGSLRKFVRAILATTKKATGATNE